MIVDDVGDTLRQLEAFVSEYFALHGTAVEIDKAMSVDEACHLLHEAFARTAPYDAVILDFNLPAQRGQSAQVDESVCSTVRALMPSTLVSHITAYHDDEVVKTHMEHTHFIDPSSRALVFSKVNHEYATRLVEHLKTYFFGKIVEERMGEIFGASAEAPFARRRRASDAGGDGPVTHELAALLRDIESHWPDLDERVRAKVKSVFHVEQTGEQVTVRLL
jgi:hypothetical protein